MALADTDAARLPTEGAAMTTTTRYAAEHAADHAADHAAEHAATSDPQKA